MNEHCRAGPITIEQLTESYRFDENLASLLTRFQYQADGITLTAAEPRPLPPAAYEASSPGLEAVFGSDESLVFVCYDDRGHQMVNPIEATLTRAIVGAVSSVSTAPRTDGGPAAAVGDDPAVTATNADNSRSPTSGGGPPDMGSASPSNPSLGVVTPHNAQRGALERTLPGSVTPNTVEKYQGGERDVIAVCGTVSDPEFARSEEKFILNPNRLLVAISRSRLLTVVVCSEALFEVAPRSRDNLSNGPVWARLFTEAMGESPDPTWTGSVAEFTGRIGTEHSDTSARVYTR